MMKTLYRPVGLTEMKLILDLDLKAFPPRLPEQPIFYPVLNKQYADQIARDWNTKDKFSGFVGFVTEFKVDSPYIDQYEEQIVGAKSHEELWIPSEDLEEMNANIVGRIKVINVFYGSGYEGVSSELTFFEGKSLRDQLRKWCEIYEYNPMDFFCEIREHWKYIFVNYRYWIEVDSSQIGVSEELKEEALVKMKAYWNDHFPGISLVEQ
ncbi:hypothetical protein ACX93W_21815 [Paenibacillus sp. CAU 1782]